MFMSINIQWTGAKAIMLACGIHIFIRQVQGNVVTLICSHAIGH